MIALSDEPPTNQNFYGMDAEEGVDFIYRQRSTARFVATLVNSTPLCCIFPRKAAAPPSFTQATVSLHAETITFERAVELFVFRHLMRGIT